MIGIPLTTLAYILANIGYFAVMSKEEILLSHAVAVVCFCYLKKRVWPIREFVGLIPGTKHILSPVVIYFERLIA